MESVDFLDKHLDPPEEESTAECEICGTRREVSDMKLVDIWPDKWVCNLRDTDCIEKYINKISFTFEE